MLDVSRSRARGFGQGLLGEDRHHEGRPELHPAPQVQPVPLQSSTRTVARRRRTTRFRRLPGRRPGVLLEGQRQAEEGVGSPVARTCRHHRVRRLGQRMAQSPLHDSQGQSRAPAARDGHGDHPLEPGPVRPGPAGRRTAATAAGRAARAATSRWRRRRRRRSSSTTTSRRRRNRQLHGPVWLLSFDEAPTNEFAATAELYDCDAGPGRSARDLPAQLRQHRAERRQPECARL